MARTALLAALVLGALHTTAAAEAELAVVQPANGVIDFGFMIANQTSTAQRIELQNIGDVAVVPTVRLCCGPVAIVAQGGSLGPGETAFWDIVAAPTDADIGSFGAFFDATFINSQGNDVTTEVAVNVVVRRTPFDARPAGFSPVGPGTTSHRTITVTNTSAAPKTITAFALTEPAFTVALHTGTLPITVPSLGTFDLDVTFAPTTPSAVFATPIDAKLDDGSTANITDAQGATTGLVTFESSFGTSWNGVPLGETWVRLERLVNFGDTPQTVTAITFTNPSEFGLTGVAVGDVLPPHSSRPVQSTFTPLVLGDRATTSTMTFSAADDIFGTNSGDGVSALVRITTGDGAPDDGVLDFGDLELGSAPVTRQLTITNISGQTLVTDRCEQLFDADVTVTADCPDFTLLAPNASFKFGVVVTPAHVGDHGGLVTFNAQGINHQLEMRVYARVVSHASTLSTHRLDFADTFEHPAMPSVQDLVLTNTGTEPLVIPPATISGDGFGIVIGPGVGALLAGESATYTIGFSPPAEGVFDATLTLGPIGAVALHGTGTLRAVSAESELEFSSVVIGQSAVAPITIHNAGTVAVAVTAVASSDPRFVAMLPADVTVPAGGDLVVSVAYAPTTPGPDAATLTIAFDGSPVPQLSVALHGQGFVHGGGGCSTHHGGSGGDATVLLVLLALTVHRRRNPAIRKLW